MKKIIIDGVEYVKKTEVQENQTKKGLTYCIIRTYSAGVWAGWYDLSKVNKIGTVYEARRLYRRWSDFTLSALANLGSKKGKEKENKYAMSVNEVFFTEIIEIIPCTEISMNFIISQPNYVE